MPLSPSPSRAPARSRRLPERVRLGRWALLGGLLGMSFTAICFAPAHWLAAGMAAASAGRIQLHAAHGTVWRGSAMLALTGGAGSRDRMDLPGRLHWRLRPHWRGIAVQLRPDCCANQPLRAQLRLGWQAGPTADVQISAHQSQWPAGLLHGLGAPWNTLQLDGHLGLHWDDWHLQWQGGRLRMHGAVEASLRNASTRLTTIRPMGSYRLIIRGPEGQGRPEAQLLTDSGPLMLSGQGRWQGQRMRFSGVASAEPAYLPALSNLLSLLGRRDGERAILNF